MDLRKIIKDNFSESITVKQNCINEGIAEQISIAAQIIFNALINDKKILACGNGGSAADAQHFTAELIGRFEQERMPLPAIALTTDTSTLTAIANDYTFDIVFAKQIKAFGKEGDILLAISTSGNSNNIIEAINTAHERGMNVIALTGKGGGEITDLITSNDILINISYERTARIQEVHILIIHALCDCIDQMLFGNI